jgi:RNA polymerase sigma factor (sigma-70 family)
MRDHNSTDPLTDRAVFENLYKDRHDGLLASVIGMVRDRERAEDITAAAFQTAWEKRAQFRGDSSLATWLHAIGLNIARRSWREERMVDQDPSALERRQGPEPDRLSALEEDQRRDLVWKALEQIPAQHRRILVDHYVNGRSVQEIARRERIPIGTVGSRLFAASRLLREAWSQVTGPGANMSEDKVRPIAEEALKRLTEELQAGRSDALKDYLAAMARFHRYSWGNVLLINAQRPTATRVAGFHAWRQLDRWVKKGEKGIVIFAPVLIKDRARSPEASQTKANEIFRLAGFRTAYVFDVAQTEGKPLPQFARTAGDPKDYGDKLKSIVTGHGIALEYDAGIKPAYGVSFGGRIKLLPGLSAPEEFSVLAHELAHELLHHRKDLPRLPETVRETQAEAVAFVVCGSVGLDTNTAARDYIALYNGDARTLAESLATIQETSSRILADLFPEERLAATPERTSLPASAHSRVFDAAAQREPTRPAPEPPAAGPDPADSITLER